MANRASKLSVMDGLSRKQRARQQREALILKVARDLLLERGYLGLTMDRIAAATEYSKGTIYQHFGCKEEIVMALAIEMMERHARLFERAATFQGQSRERMTAIGVAEELFVTLYPDDVRASLITKLASIRDKTTTQRQLQLRGCEHRCMSIVTGIVRDAISNNDLQLPDDVRPEDLCFALWAATFGANVLRVLDFPLAELGINDPPRSVMRSCQTLMDGYAWKPLSHDWDYDATIARIRDEVFSHELS